MEQVYDCGNIWLVVASFLAGALNAVAGGGSFLSFPALLSVGVPPIQANATNTVSVWPGQLTSIAGYREELKHNLRLLIPLFIAAAAGGLAGGIVLLLTRQATFMRFVPWLLLIAAILFAVSSPVSHWLQIRNRGKELRNQGLSQVLLFCGTIVVCFYTGYFGAGSGFLIMSLLAVFGIENINQINALKVFTTTLANGVAAITFIIEKQVLWHHFILMMIAAAIGGYLGSRYSRRLHPRLMRAVVVAIGLFLSAYFFWKQT